MTESRFNNFLDECEFIASKSKPKLIKIADQDNKGKFSDDFRKFAKQGDYKLIYQTAIDNSDYTYLIFDDSFFQFSYERTNDDMEYKVRYAFYQNPNHYISIEDFIIQELDIPIEELDPSATYSFQKEYQQHIIESEFNSGSLMIRYDLDKKGYKPKLHSASHFHIGHNNETRIPCKKVLTPVSFFLFIIKHVYSNIWKQIINDRQHKVRKIIEGYKKQCKDLDSKFWQASEEEDIYFF